MKFSLSTKQLRTSFAFLRCFLVEVVVFTDLMAEPINQERLRADLQNKLALFFKSVSLPRITCFLVYFVSVIWKVLVSLIC